MGTLAKMNTTTMKKKEVDTHREDREDDADRAVSAQEKMNMIMRKSIMMTRKKSIMVTRKKSIMMMGLGHDIQEKGAGERNYQGIMMIILEMAQEHAVREAPNEMVQEHAPQEMNMPIILDMVQEQVHLDGPGQKKSGNLAILDRWEVNLHEEEDNGSLM